MIFMELPQLLASAEKKYKKRLEKFFTEVYHDTILLSHGIDHHRRVWSFGKELLAQLPEESFTYEPLIPEKLIIASYLHDSGMSVDTGPRHGIKSRIFCEQFLRKYKLPEIEFTDVLYTIENHDYKEYSRTDQEAILLTILSVADDLDAFGFIGIYRYLEIYLTRHMPIRDLGFLINENSINRYKHFVNSFGFNQALVEKHGRRYQIIITFFKEYNKQCNDYQFDTSLPSGYCGVAEIIQNMMQQDLTPDRLYSHIREISDDKVLNWYFSELKNELSSIL
jgi:HD superfamily phosphodiesterase